MKNLRLCCAIALSILTLTGVAQIRPGLKSTIAVINQAREKLPIEKLYLQTDKPYYILGDTLHFKAYLLNGDFFTGSARSGLLYVELDNEYGRSVKRIMVPVYAGLAAANIPLSEDEILEGGYTLRAYTNWMRNFGEDYIFKKSIYVSALSNSTLVQAAFKLDSVKGKNHVQGKIKLLAMDNNDLRLKDVQLRVLNGKRTLLRDKAMTGIDGGFAINFDLADKTTVNNLAVQVLQKGKGADTTKLIIPVTINRPENTDLQFMPEGGSLVAGFRAKVGFKAIGEDGKATDVSGSIYNAAQQVVATFKTLHKGMGNFEFTPLAGDKYTARAVLPGGLVKTYPLPVVNPAGTVLRITPKGTDSLAILISLATGQPGISTYYLVSQSRGVVCYAQSVNLVNGQSVVTPISTALFPTGVTRFTLLNAANQPVNERQIFIDHHDALQVNVGTDRPAYAIRDSIALTLDVKDKNGQPVKGAFSVAVTDDDQVKTDSLGANIVNSMLFSSDLKGDVDEPGYYFSSANKTAELDNLLLTQGWTGFDLKKIFSPKPDPIKFIAEPEFMVQGKVTNFLNKPVENSSVMLLSKKPAMILDTLTGKDGIFTFKGFMPVDTATFQLTSHNKRGKNSNVNIEMLNEFKPPVFMVPNRLPTPWYVNTDTLLLNSSNTKLAQLNAEANFRGEGNRLKEVVIKEQKVIKDSKHLVAPSAYDLVIDEQELLKAGNMTLTQLLQTKVKGFQIQGIGALTPFSRSFLTSFVVDRQLVYFVIDGVSLNGLFDGNSMGPLRDPDRYQFLKSNTDYFTAEDIKGIEIMKTAGASSRYGFYYVTTDSAGNPVQIPPTFTYIEITTRSGHGPFMRKTPGTYLYKPLPFTMPTQFYSPKYTVKNKATGIGTDLRSTVYWTPHIATDSTGKATISFYSADKPANYTIIVEGADLVGNVGYRRQKIMVKAAATP